MENLITFLLASFCCFNGIGWFFVIIACMADSRFPHGIITEILSHKNIFGKILVLIITIFFIPSIISAYIIIPISSFIIFMWNLGNKK